MGDMCDICGDYGYTDALMTCSQCKTSREHIYCMRTLHEEPIDDWLCEECESSSKPKPLVSHQTTELPGTSKSSNPMEARSGSELRIESRKSLHGTRVGSIPREKMVATGKTKYICVNEAIRLSSGEKNSLSSSNVKRLGPKIGVRQLERTVTRPKTVALSFSSQQDLASGSWRQPKPQERGNVEISKRKLPKTKTLTEIQRSVSSLRPSLDPTNKHIHKGNPAELQLPQTEGKRSMIKSSSAPSTNALQGGNDDTAIELRTCDAENVNNNILLDLEKCSRTPALDALWKGSCSIQDDHSHGKKCHQIQAHPPSQVRRKIYEFSKKMPEVIHFQLVPAKKFWTDLFEEHIPDERDIGLYFIPSAKERLDDYISLLESISAKNMALRIQLADVELLIFTSKLLPVNCPFWEGNNFLWGVFHPMKQDTAALLKNSRLTLSVQPSDNRNGGHHNQEDDHEVDMDIDMIGGISVGREDVRVPRQLITGKVTDMKEQHSETTKAFHGLVNVKMGQHQDALIPPGFEDVYRRRVEGSLSLENSVGVREVKIEKTR